MRVGIFANRDFGQNHSLPTPKGIGHVASRRESEVCTFAVRSAMANAWNSMGSSLPYELYLDVSVAGRHGVVLGVVLGKHTQRTVILRSASYDLASDAQEKNDVLSGVYRDTQTSHWIH